MIKTNWICFIFFKVKSKFISRLYRKSGSSSSHQKSRKLLIKKIKSFSNPDSRYHATYGGIGDADIQILYIESRSWKGKPQTNGLALTWHKNNYIQLNGNGQNKIVE